MLGPATAVHNGALQMLLLLSWIVTHQATCKTALHIDKRYGPDCFLLAYPVNTLHLFPFIWNRRGFFLTY